MSDRLNFLPKKYSWWDVTKATEESGKSLAELFDFKSGLLIWRNTKDTPNELPERTQDDFDLKGDLGKT